MIGHLHVLIYIFLGTANRGWDLGYHFTYGVIFTFLGTIMWLPEVGVETFTILGQMLLKLPMLNRRTLADVNGTITSRMVIGRVKCSVAVNDNVVLVWFSPI